MLSYAPNIQHNSIHLKNIQCHDNKQNNIKQNDIKQNDIKPNYFQNNYIEQNDLEYHVSHQNGIREDDIYRMTF